MAVNVEAVAPEIAVPLSYHWYPAAPDGVDNSIDWPSQKSNELVLELIEASGNGLTFTRIEVVPIHPFELVTVNS